MHGQRRWQCACGFCNAGETLYTRKLAPDPYNWYKICYNMCLTRGGMLASAALRTKSTHTHIPVPGQKARLTGLISCMHTSVPGQKARLNGLISCMHTSNKGVLQQ